MSNDFSFSQAFDLSIFVRGKSAKHQSELEYKANDKSNMTKVSKVLNDKLIKWYDKPISKLKMSKMLVVLH